MPTPAFRFSLKTFFLVLLFGSLAASNLFTSYRWKQAREENTALRKEVGYLNVEDPDKLNLVAVKTLDDLTWRWRVHVPKGSRPQIRISGQAIPLNGFSASYSGTTLPPGDYLLTAAVRPNRFNEWTLTLGYDNGSSTTSIAPPCAGWLEKQSRASGWSTSQAGTNGTEVHPLDETFTLLRVRAMVPSADGTSASTTAQPSDGILIWIER